MESWPTVPSLTPNSSLSSSPEQNSRQPSQKLWGLGKSPGRDVQLSSGNSSIINFDWREEAEPKRDSNSPFLTHFRTSGESGRETGRKGINWRRGKVPECPSLLPSIPLCSRPLSPLSQEDLPEGPRSLFLVPSCCSHRPSAGQTAWAPRPAVWSLPFPLGGRDLQRQDRHAVRPSDVGCCAGLGPWGVYRCIHVWVCVCVSAPGSGMWHVGRWPFESVATAPLTPVAPMPQRRCLRSLILLLARAVTPGREILWVYPGNWETAWRHHLASCWWSQIGSPVTKARGPPAYFENWGSGISAFLSSLCP